MKNLKTFESFSSNMDNEVLNEEIFDKTRKFFTGHESGEKRDEKMMDFMKSLEEAKEAVAKAPSRFVFNEEDILKQAKKNNYLGGIRIQRGGRNKKMFYVVYDKGLTGFQSLASLMGDKRRESGI